ncbi:unnamed protein product [Timema podura]|uniref:Uncharacterized protein n=1 Tax=Timema podura TaxID=61482 RepID=A0ABN7P4W6_TIMPD|nr:unnamed protein product [Timema podura]
MAHQYLYWRVTVQAQATGVHQSCRITEKPDSPWFIASDAASYDHYAPSGLPWQLFLHSFKTSFHCLSCPICLSRKEYITRDSGSQFIVYHLDIVKEGNSAPAPVEDTADHDGLVVGVIASTPRDYRIMIQVFSCFTSPSYLLSWSL